MRLGTNVKGENMKVLKNNYNYEEKVIKNTDMYPRKIVCECCESELEYEKSDIKNGAFGCAYITCPLCDSQNFIDDGENELTLTKDNVEFPTHFWHTCKENGAVDNCNSNEVKTAIKRGIGYFRQNKNESHWSTQCGNMYVSVNRWEDDEQYEINVTNDFYTTDIPFEAADY